MDAERTNTVKIQLIRFQKRRETVLGMMMEKLCVIHSACILRMCVILNAGVIGYSGWQWTRTSTPDCSHRGRQGERANIEQKKGFLSMCGLPWRSETNFTLEKRHTQKQWQL